MKTKIVGYFHNQCCFPAKTLGLLGLQQHNREEFGLREHLAFPARHLHCRPLGHAVSIARLKALVPSSCVLDA